MPTYKLGNNTYDVYQTGNGTPPPAGATDVSGSRGTEVAVQQPVAPTPTTSTNPIDSRTLPTGPMGDFSSLFQQGQSLLGQGQTQTTPTQYTTPALIEEAKKAAEAKKTLINGQFDSMDAEAQRRGAMEIGTADNTIGRVRGDGFSSAAEAYISDVTARSEKRLNDLKQQRQQALASLDTELAGNIQKLMISEMERQDKLAEVQFSRLATVMGLGLQFQGQQDARSKPVELNGVLYEKQSNGTYKPVAGVGNKPVKQLGDQLWEQQEDGSWKVVADSTSVQHSSSYLEYQDYARDEQTRGKQPVSFNDYLSMDANRKAVRSTTNVYGAGDVKAEREVMKDTVNAGILKLAKTVNPKTGKLWTWGDVSQTIIDQGFDPKEFDDALHRAYTSQAEYEAWKKTQK